MRGPTLFSDGFSGTVVAASARAQRVSACELFVIDTRTGRVTRGECVSALRNRVRLVLSADAGLEAGRHYEVCSQRPGQSRPPGATRCISRGAALARLEANRAPGFGLPTVIAEFVFDDLTEEED